MMVTKDPARGRGRPRKHPDELAGRQLAIRLRDTEREGLRELADEQGMSLSAYIADVLRRHLERSG